MFGPRIITGAACALALGASTAQAGTATITYTSSTKFRVPSGVTTLQVLAIGGAGGSVVVPDSSANHADVKVLGGLGAQTAATITVVPTTQLSIDVNTGAGLAGQFLAPAGNGGGLSAVRDDNGYIVVAAGGGGAGGSQPYPYASTSILPGAGGNAGSTAGAGSTGAQSGSGGFGEGGKAGTVSAGGAAGDTRSGIPATPGTKGQGGSGSGLTSSADATPAVFAVFAAGGGGGAGYFGGGGGGGSNAVYRSGGGGGYASAGGGGAGRSYVSDTGNATGGVISTADRLAQPVVRLTFNDSTPPTVQLAGATSNATQFAGQAGVDGGDAASVTVEFFAGATATGTPAVTATAAVDPTTGGFTLPTPALTDGTWTARVKQIDAAGNVGFSLAQTFSVDATPPTIDFSGVRPTYVLGEVAAAGITCKDASSGVTACTAPVLVDTAVAGPHTISVTATDAAGNTVTQSASYTVIAPAPAPAPAPTPTPIPLPVVKKADAKFKITKTTVTRSGTSLAIKLSGSVAAGATGTVSVGKSSVKVSKKGTWSLSTKVKGGPSGVKITVNYSGDATYAALAVTKTAKPASAKKK